MRRFAPPVSRSCIAVCVLVLSVWVSTPAAQQSPRPIADPNVNMVRGFTKDDGDPYLQRQNEPSLAVSTRNPCHLVGGANDYRSVDIPFDDTPIPANGEPNISLAGDAWLGLFKSFDCGQKWMSTLLPGFPQDKSGKALQLKGYEAGADPTVRAAHNGLFYYSGMVFNRGAQGESKIFVARLIDNNNKERGDPIEFLDVATIDTGTKGQFLDKPWLAVDVPRNSFGPGSTLATGTTSASGSCTVNGRQVPAGNAYMAWARFTGNSSQHSKLMFARSEDCGKTWKANPISTNQTLSQGANIAVAPHDGTVYLTWREFAGNNNPVNIWVAVSSDGGKNFSSPKMIAADVKTFDQIKSGTKFRSNALPAIIADHQDRVYIAWSATGYAWAYDAGVRTPNADARIVMTVSSDRGKTFAPAFAIDPNVPEDPADPKPRRGHQMMPQLAFAAGKIQAIYYDAREDLSNVFKNFIDDKDVKPGSLRHTIDVRGAQADPASRPVFVPLGSDSLEISKYRRMLADVKDEQGNVVRQSIEVGANPPNLPMYAAGSMPFMGDYIDVSGLASFPIQTAGGQQVWQPNIGPLNWAISASALTTSTMGFPMLPVFHAAWTDNRDVKRVDPNVCTVDPKATGERNANIYTSRLTPGLYVGSPGNTKPLGRRLHPVTKEPTDELLQRGFVVFAQNTTDTQKFYRFTIVNQPPGGRASFRQFDRPVNQSAGETPGVSVPLTHVRVGIPKGSTAARTVYVSSTDPAAQILVNIEELELVPDQSTAGGDDDGGETPKSVWAPKADGLRGSVLLNPDRTNPPIENPDLDDPGDPTVPAIATDEVHDPSMFEARFYKYPKGTASRMLDVRNPDPENPDPENPDPENPDPENPDPENPDPENPDPENPDPENTDLINPDPENPDPENPDPENPDPENVSLLNTAPDVDPANSTITDVAWRVHNSGNTTSAYRFRPSLAKKVDGAKYQLIVTRRYMVPTMSTYTKDGQVFCQPVYKSQNQVLVNIENFQPRTPDPENPDPENPDPENPDPENPDPENANFFLQPDETATVTLRVFTPGDDPADLPDSEEKVAGKTSARAANTDETEPTTAVAGPDLTLSEPPPTFAPARVRPGQTATVTWTLTNRGTAGAVAPLSGVIKNNVYLSTDAFLDRFDSKIGNTITTPATLAMPLRHCADPGVFTDPTCRRVFTTPVVMPSTPGQYYVIIVTDDDNDADEFDESGTPLAENDSEVFEADELNNVVVVPIAVDAFQLAFVQQPSSTTQDFTMTPPVTVAVVHSDGGPVTTADVPFVNLAIQANPGGGVLSGALSQTPTPTANGGLVTFADLRINHPGTGYTLAASAALTIGAVSAAFDIEVDLPPVVQNDSYTINEDGTLNVAAPGVLTNDSDPPTKGIKPPSYNFDSVEVSEPMHGSVTLNLDGSFTYTPLAQFNGTDSFTYVARDGRAGNTTVGTVTVTVNAVNDAPSFTRGADQSVAEDAGPQTVPNWATVIRVGPVDESETGQVVDFIVSNNNTALFSSQPAVSPNGTLTFTSAPNASGVAVVTVTAHDNGGTANGGDDTSDPQTFTITVSGENDAPVATADSYSTHEDTPFGVDAGPNLLFGLLANDIDPDTGTNAGLVAEYLTTTTNGTLLPHQNGSFSYTPNPHFHGTDSFTYRAFDGTTTGNTVTVTITVLSVNDVPTFTKGPNQTAPSGNVAQSVPGWATGISVGPANESSQVLDFIVSNDNTGIFNVQPAVSATGTLTFTPKQNQTGTAIVTVRAHDNGGTANGGVDTSAPQTFSITVTNTAQNFIVTNTNDSGTGSLRAAIANANANPSADVISFNIPGGGVRTIALLSALPSITQPVTINATTQPGFSGTPLVELNGANAGAHAHGLDIDASNVTVRGFTINRFSGNGIDINGANNFIAGNYIGTNATASAALPNLQDGVQVFGAPNVIGGTAASLRNVVSGNGRHGIFIVNTQAAGNSVRGNYIGTNAAGTSAIANGAHGVLVEQSNSTTIGGDGTGDGNLISGNQGSGIFINFCSFEFCGGHTIAGNTIGTNAAGTSAVPNHLKGVHVNRAPRNVIRGNLISGNGDPNQNPHGIGVLLQSSPISEQEPDAETRYGDQRVYGNLIGTARDGITPIPNLYWGVGVEGAAKATIGGDAAADGNTIAFNGQGGVAIGAGEPTPNTVVKHNRIFSNAVFGIQVAIGAGNLISQNAIYDNTALGIDLGSPLGVTPNDPGDADTGANNLQNFPVLTTAFSNGVGTTVAGTINTTPSTQVTIELFSSPAADASGYGEGKTFLGTVTLATDASGNGSFSTGVAPLAPGSVVTATATALGSTSEFSLAKTVTDNNPPTTTNDSAVTASGQSATLLPGANDTDPDVAAPQVLATVRTMPEGAPVLMSPGDVAVVNATGLGYFTGGQLAAAVPGSIGILNTATNAIVGSIPLPQNGGSTLNRVNQSTQIVYMRAGTNLLAIDGRPASEAFNQIILSLSLGNIAAMAVDEGKGRLYIAASSAGPGTVVQGHVAVLDIDPESPTFHQAIQDVPLGLSTLPLSLVVNTATNKVYVTAAGLHVIDGTTFNRTFIGSATGALALNEPDNLIFMVNGTNLFVTDGATDTPMLFPGNVNAVTLPAQVNPGQPDRIAIHQATGQIYLRAGEFPNGSRLIVVDGRRHNPPAVNNPTLGSVVATLPLGRENNNSMVAIDQAANRVITTSFSDTETTVIDVLTNLPVGTIQSPQTTSRVTLDLVHHRAYVTGGFGLIQVVDLAGGTPHAVVPVGVEGNFGAVNTTNHSIYAPRTGTTASVERIDATGSLGTIALPHADGRMTMLLRNPVTNRLYALNGGSTVAGGTDALPGFVNVIDGSTNAVLASVPVGPLPFLGMAINEATNTIYVGSASAGFAFPGGITVIDGTTNTAVQANVSQIPANNSVPGQVQFIRDFAVNQATNKVYFRITAGSPATLGVLDGTTNIATALPNLPPAPATTAGLNIIRVNPVLNRIYVGGQVFGSPNQVFVLNGATNALVATLTLGGPTNFLATQSYLAVNKTTGRVFVADFGANTVSVIDGATNTVLTTMAVGRGPSTVAVNETANRIYVGNALDKTLTIIDGAAMRVAATVALPLTPIWLNVDETVSQVYATGAQHEPGMMVIQDPGTAAPNVTAVTNGANGTVVLNADGSVTYTANTGFVGNDSFTYTATDAGGLQTTGTVNVVVKAPLVIPGTLADTTVGASYSQNVGATGGTPSYTWTLTGQLPGGLSLNTATGLVSGRATQSGTFTIQVTVRDSGIQVATRDYTINVGPPVVTTTALPAAFVNTPYSQQLGVGGATGTVAWTINKHNNPLLDWLSISTDGILSGTPPGPGGTTPSFTVIATDSLEQVATRSLSLFVNAPLTVLQPREGIVLETQPGLSFVGGNGVRSATKTAGQLPPGLLLLANGSFTGTPMRHGDYQFTVEVKDCELGTNGLPTCNNQTTQQVTSVNLAMRVSAKDQQGSSQTQPAISFGGLNGRRFAQVFTVGAHGTLTGIGLQNLSCPAVTPVTVSIQRLTTSGVPDGNTIASGTAVANLNAIAIAPPVPTTIGERLAFIVSSPVACNVTNASTSDFYNGGDAYADSGAGWVSLLETDGRYDVPSFRTLIQPAMEITYLNRSRGSNVTATLLPASGKVLIVGNSTAAELYDPATKTSTLTTGAMAFSRSQHTATLLADGKVLIVGGNVPGNPFNTKTATAEIFDPATGLFAMVPGQLAFARDRHQAARLDDGRVLITGGVNDSNTVRLIAAEIYDPATQQFTSAGNTLSGREQHIMTTLQSGKVLIAAGYTSGGPSAEIFDPATGQFNATLGNMVVFGRGQATGTLLANGKVLIAGGQSGDVLASAELYDPNAATNAFTATGSLSHPRFVHAATRVGDAVLIAGGFDQQNGANYIQPLATLELYDSAAGTFSSAGAMETVRQGPAAVTLTDGGTALIVGGSTHSWMSGNTAELYDSAAALRMSPTTLAAGTPGEEYPPVIFTAAGGSGTGYAISMVPGTLPPGMTYDALSRTLGGTPSATGDYRLGFRVSDSLGRVLLQTLTLRVGNTITITSPYRLVDGAVNASYSVQLTSTGVSPVMWSLAPASSALPQGLSLGPAGAITGAPAVSGYHNFTVRAIGDDGQEAIKVLSINVNQPLTINTTSLNNVDLFGGGPNCVSASNGVGTRTWDISLGALPAGLAINQTNGCFTGTVLATGSFTFTVRVMDQASPAQTATREFTIKSWAIDQNTGGFGDSPVAFGGAARIAQRVIAGVSGTLHAVRANGLQCVPGTIVAAEIHGLTPAGTPDGNVMASGQAAYFFSSIVLTSPQFFAADAQFALVFSANDSCTVHPSAFDAYPGAGYVTPNGTDWHPLTGAEGRDIPFATLLDPAGGVIPMTTWRGDHAETLLSNGKVLLSGGSGSNQAELFDPATNTMSPVTNVNTLAIATMTSPRSGHTATLLDDGRVLIAGGSNNQGNRLASAEIYDRTQGTFTAIAPMNAARADHTATLLQDGRVLIAGGRSATGNSLQTAELYDPSSGTFELLGTMHSTRHEHTATLLPDGRVLLAGGWGGGQATAELYDPGAMWFFATDGQMVIRRSRHTATLLGDGTVLIAGGTGNSEAQSSAELFDPATGTNANGTFAAIPGMSARRDDHSAVLLADGSVLVAGGLRDTTCCGISHEPQASMERYVPGSGWMSASSMVAARYRHTATVLGDGRVLLAGTWGWSNAAPRMAEIYDVATSFFASASKDMVGSVGAPFSQSVAPAGDNGPWTVTHLSGDLPPGLSFNDAAADITGTPTQPGTYTSSFSITDATSRVTYFAVTIRINPVVITSAALPTAYQGVFYSAQLSGIGVGGIVSWQIISGGLPPGLAPAATFASDGTINGTPTVSCCTYSFTVRATDSIGQSTTKVISIAVQQPLNITTTSLGDGIAGNTYFGCINTTGGSGLRTYALSGQIPIGLEINASTGCFLNAWPLEVVHQPGTFAFSVSVQDESNPPQQDTQPFTITVHAHDQQIGTDGSSAVTLPSTRRVAQVYRAGSPFPLSGISVFAMTCNAGTQATFSVYPVTGAPARPDESDPPLASLTLTANSGGFFNTGYAAFPTMVAIPQGSFFAVVVSFTDTCTGQGWASQDFYRSGQAWVHDGLSWETALTVLGKYDLPFGTLVLPPMNQLFTSGWHGGHDATTLPNGRLLLVGSDDRLELYDPETNTLTDVPGTMANPRHQPTATRLANGNVLIVGGQWWNTAQNVSVASTTTTIYNTPPPHLAAEPGSFGPGPNMTVGRFGHRATRLNDDRVLITGGWTYDLSGQQQTLDTALIFEADGSAFTTVNMTGARVKHSATVMADGRVLIVGGWTGEPFPGTVAEIFDPGTDTFTAVMHWPGKWPALHTATLLTTGQHSGKVLIAGGSSGVFPDLDPTGLLFDPAAGTFSNYSTLAVPRFEHTATMLADGRIAFTGGVTDWADNLATPTIEIFDPNTHISTIAGDLIIDRQVHAADLMTVGGAPTLVVSGGWGSSSMPGKTVEMFDYLAGALTVTTASLPPGVTSGQYLAAPLAASGGSGAGYSFALAWGALPPGLSISDGEIVGTPTATGVYHFTIAVTDGAANVAYRALSIRVED